LLGKLDTQFSGLVGEVKAEEVVAGSTSVPKHSGHATAVAKKVKKFNQTTRADAKQYLWVHKTFPKELEFMAEVEAATMALYNLFVPGIAPKSRVIYHKEEDSYTVIDADGRERVDDASTYDIVGVAAKMLPTFQDFETYLSGGKIDAHLDYLVANGLPEAMAVSLFCQEEDGHARNFVLSAGRVKRIDGDMDWFGLTGKPGWRGPRTYPACSAVAPEEAYRWHPDDIDQFPVLKHQDPYYWPATFRAVFTASYGYSREVVDAFSRLNKAPDPRKTHKKETDFIHKSYLTFLRIVLMPADAIKATLAAHMTDPRRLAELQAHVLAHQAALKKTLYRSRRFYLWWQNCFRKGHLQAIAADLDAYNAALKPKLAALRVDMVAWRANYRTFARDVAVNDIYAALTQLREVELSLPITDPRRTLISVMAGELWREFNRFKALSEPSVRQFSDFKRTASCSYQGVMRLYGFVDGVSRSTSGDPLHALLGKFDVKMRLALRQMLYSRFVPDEEATPVTAAVVGVGQGGGGGLVAAAGQRGAGVTPVGQGGGSVRPQAVVDLSRSLPALPLMSAVPAVPGPAKPLAGAALVGAATAWMADKRNRRVVMAIFAATLSEYKEKVEGVGAYFSRRGWRLPAAKPMDDAYKKLIDEHVSDDMFVPLLISEYSRLSMAGPWEKDAFHVQLAWNLMGCFARRQASERYVLRLQHRVTMTRTEAELTQQVVVSMPLARQFVEALCPSEVRAVRATTTRTGERVTPPAGAAVTEGTTVRLATNPHRLLHSTRPTALAAVDEDDEEWAMVETAEQRARALKLAAGAGRR
jgi:hypothetical protein